MTLVKELIAEMQIFFSELLVLCTTSISMILHMMTLSVLVATHEITPRAFASEF